ncbi:MAG: hypothetical protein ACOCRX_05075 [Candidatus Woesearchaeota archaeon]
MKSEYMTRLKEKSKKTEKKLVSILFSILGSVFLITGFISYATNGDPMTVIRSFIIGTFLIVLCLLIIFSTPHSESSKVVSEQISKKVLNPSSKNEN